MLRPTLIAALTFALAACADSNGAINPEAERVLPVALATATPGPAAPPIRTTAVLAHKDEMRLAFKVGGVIAQVAVDEGARVQAGQVLARLEMAEIGSQVEQTRQLLAKAERDLERGERLYKEQVIALEALQDLRTQRDIARQNVKAMAFNREYAEIVAPSDGVVLRKLAMARETVAPGTPVLGFGSATQGFVLKASLSDRDVVQLKLEDAATVRFDALPGVAFDAAVSRLPAAADPRTGMFDIELALGAADPRLKSGLVARVALVPASASDGERIHVPIAAILEGDRDRASVFVYDEAQTRASRRAVEVAFIDGETVALMRGLDAGMRVVTDGAAYVEDGRKVRVVE